MDNNSKNTPAKPTVASKSGGAKPSAIKPTIGTTAVGRMTSKMAPKSDFKARLKARWSKLTDADLATVDGRHDALPDLLVKRQGLAKEQAEKDSKAFFADSHPKSGTSTKPL